MKDLGTQNGWRQEPAEYRHCLNKGLEHTKRIKMEIAGPRCLYRYTCPTCEITWEVDMGD